MCTFVSAVVKSYVKSHVESVGTLFAAYQCTECAAHLLTYWAANYCSIGAAIG